MSPSTPLEPDAPSSVSLCLIVRDGAEFLPRCLGSTQGIVDEIVAVDTGSGDDTVAILEGFGAKVVRFEWDGDFARARNEAIAHASGDWILFLDADEALDQGTKANLRELCVYRQERVSYGVAIRSYLSDDEDPAAVDEHHMTRLFNRRAGHYYVGSLHEQLMGSRHTNLPAETLCIWHWGYQPRHAAAKQGRNEVLMARVLQLSVSAQGALTAALAATDGNEKLKHAEAVLGHFPRLGSISPLFAGIGAVQAVEAHVLKGDGKGALARARALETEWPPAMEEPMLHVALGRAWALLGHWDDAEAAYRAAWALAQEDPVQALTDVPQAAHAALSLAVSLGQKGAVAEMIEVLQRLRAMPETLPEFAGRAAAFLVPAFLAEGEQDKALAMANAAVAQFPDERAELANQFLSAESLVPAFKLMSPLWDRATLTERVNMMTADLAGHPQGAALQQWFMSEYGSRQP